MADFETPQDLIDTAREVIERDGWHQGDFHEGAGSLVDVERREELARTAPVCAMGALRRAAFGRASGIAWHKVNADLYYQAERLLAAQVDRERFASVPGFNDAESTTKEDVLLAFKRAAER